MSQYVERTYRKTARAEDLVSFQVQIKETDLWISSEINLYDEAVGLVLDCRQQLETYVKTHPEFTTSLLPFTEDPFAPPIVREMIEATRKVGVGPMASVAGAIAQYVAVGLLNFTDQVIVENGGDIFLRANRPVSVSIFAGDSQLSERLGLLIPVEQMPLGVCSSSASIGHSLSMGTADAVCLLSSSAAQADGAATAVGNKIKGKDDMEKAAQWAKQIEGIVGGVLILEEKMATWGDIELVGL